MNRALVRERRYAVAEVSESNRLERFTKTERAVHWVQAVTFLTLLVSGLVLSISSLESVIGNRALVREIHLSAAFFFFFGPALIALSADRWAMGEDVEAVDRWDSDDLRWLIPFPILRLFGVKTPPQGRFNAGQKLNAIFVAWSTLTFTLTGFIMWQNRRFPLDIVARANNVHTTLAYIALAAFLGHLFLATVWPGTRPSLRAIVLGWVRKDWAFEHHPKWVRSFRPRPAAPPHDQARAAIQLFLGSFACLFACRVLFFAIGANVTDKVTGWLYDVTSWPGAAAIHPATAIHVFDWIGSVYGLLCLASWLYADHFRHAVDHTRESSSA